MKVVLLKDVNGTGKADEVVTVSDGYARNYLFPRKLAREADAAALSEVAAREASRARSAALELQAARDVAEKLNGQNVAISVKCGTSGKLFGAITSKEIAAAVQEKLGITLDKKKIQMDDIKSVGEYTAAVKLHQNVTASVKVTVSAQ